MPYLFLPQPTLDFCKRLIVALVAFLDLMRKSSAIFRYPLGNVHLVPRFEVLENDLILASGEELADNVHSLAGLLENLLCLGGVLLAHDDDHAKTGVPSASEFAGLDVTGLLEPFKNWWHGPR